MPHHSYDRVRPCHVTHKLSYDMPHGTYPRFNDTSPHSLKDSNMSPKVKIMEEEGVEVCSLTRRISGVEGHVGALE